MAGLAHGLPVVTTLGRLSEPFSRRSNCARSLPAGDAAALVAVAESLLADPAARTALARRGGPFIKNASRWNGPSIDSFKTISRGRLAGRLTNHEPIRYCYRRFRQDRRHGSRQSRLGGILGQARRRGPFGNASRRGRFIGVFERENPSRDQALELVHVRRALVGSRRTRLRQANGGGRRHVLVNGGNCPWNDVNWVHHVHAANAPNAWGGPARRFKKHFNYRLWIAQERAIVPKARLIITTCDKNRRNIVNRLGVAAARIEVVYYGVDAEVFHPIDDKRRVELRRRLDLPIDRPIAAFVGALGDRRKGFDTLFAAWTALCRDPAWPVLLLVVGKGAELPLWRKRAVAAGLTERVRFLGFRRDAADIFRACDAHVLPSRYEGYSLVTQEALACGLPAMVSRASGIAERYPSDLNDLLIDDPENPEELVERLRRWHLGRDDYRAAVSALSETLRGHSWDDMAAAIVARVERDATIVPSPNALETAATISPVAASFLITDMSTNPL